MVRQGNMDDQWAIVHMLKRRERDWNISFRSLSFNWLFAAHGVNNKGAFFGRGRCYRVSIPVTGRVRFANGGVSFCKVMNGEHDEYVDKLRAYFLSGYCRTKDMTSISCTRKRSWREWQARFPTRIFSGVPFRIFQKMGCSGRGDKKCLLIVITVI